MIKNILIGLDGEEHTEKALDYALHLAKTMNATLTGIHVLNLYLKQFHSEIYAQGRREYLTHVEILLQDQADRLMNAFQERAAAAGVTVAEKRRRGEPLEEILAETQESGYDLVVVGGKQLRGIERLKSANLPNKLEQKITVPLLIVKHRVGG